ncbi:serine/threonine-protein phosphatase 4 regulatory subunit 4-like isoform X3 [Zootermopsis nevadensis]|uniref:serine/threonine-protein phosphatase 4 regulatory subunit 4-like isoform X3 n=1 Tax=Zootermopsis nevadensis TaxID=136037 RepID=UPI000B8E37D1|nr:serine/threonine-protein phosphatase 4 regulatory subunit 4-like isoform X3 [Zootermopsis nevadensis]
MTTAFVTSWAKPSYSCVCSRVGEEVQRLSVIHSLPFLLTEDEPQCMQKVLSKVQQVLPSASVEFHLAASSTFLMILEKKLVHPRTFTQTFLQSILSFIDSRDPVVASAWLETLLDVIDLLPANVIKSDILPLAISRQIAQSISARLTACKLLGKMATKFEPYMLKKDVLPLIHSLCQDVNYEVRACICSQLHYVARSLDAETVKLALLPSLVELASDEESCVRLEAVETIVNMLPNLQTDSVKFTIIPLVKKMCEQSLRAEDSVMVKMSEQFGKLCLALENLLTPQEKVWMLRHYQKMAELGLLHAIKPNVADFTRMPDVVPDTTNNHVACRYNCAYNFPAIAMFYSSAGKMDNFNKQLYPTFQDLASDPYFIVRRKIACGLNEIAGVLGAGNSVLKPELIKLLGDNDEEVLRGLVPRLGETLMLLSKAGTFSPDVMDSTVMDIGQALLRCEAVISMTTNWRLHTVILGQLECLPLCMPSDFIYSHFVPVIFNRIYVARPVPCRMAAGRTLLVFLRYNAKQIQSSAIQARINTDLCGSDSCYKRMLYVKMCAIAMDLFSRRYFKDHFFRPLIGLSDDRVPNIRLKLVMILPKLKAMLCLPRDRELLTCLEACISNLLLHEKDQDVSAQLQLTIQALAAIEVREEVAESPLPVSKEDGEDKRKADEEAKLMSDHVSALRKRKVTDQADPKRRSVELKNTPVLSAAERKNFLSNIPTSSLVRTSVRHSAAFGNDVPHKDSVNSLKFAAATNGVSQQAEQTYISLAKRSAVGCCSHSRFGLPQSILSTKDNDFCRCLAGNKEMNLHTLRLLQENLFASASLPQLRAETNNLNEDSAIHLRDCLHIGRQETTNMHDKWPAECKVCALNHESSYTLATNHAIGSSESSTRFIVSSLEDEFYVDAGIRIPQQLTTSDFTPLPSRIPNLRDILFKKNRTVIDTNLQNISQSASQKEMKTEYMASPESGNRSPETKPNFSTMHKTNNVSTTSKSSLSVNITTKKTFIPSNINRRNSGVFSGKVDYQTQQTAKGKLNLTNKQKPGGSFTTTNRRHSYMEGDKVVKIKSSDVSEGKKDFSVSEKRRHSYLEQIATDDGVEQNIGNFTVKKLNTLSETKSSVNSVTDRRHSYNSGVQNNRVDIEVPFLKRGAASNRHSIGSETRKSILHSQSQIKRGLSLDRGTGTDVTVVGSAVKRQSMVVPSTVTHAMRRHSSLERDDINTLRVKEKIVGNKFLSSSMIFASAGGKTAVNETAEYNRHTQRDIHSMDNVGAISKGNYTSKIPRGGGTSPGNSRAASPTVLVCGSNSRLRQRTAPNSRASSPTGAEKLQQGLSVGSLTCSMGNLKLAEPGTSRLPVRNFSRLQ